ncbi:MAG TPA: (d)CMP kinase, partial [Balneolaceae bacterium]|nr:(d)CMP kinase [Balneolaceae bacterium]
TDSNRSSDPLKQADDAILVDTSDMNFDEQVAFISQKIEQLISQQKT